VYTVSIRQCIIKCLILGE